MLNMQSMAKFKSMVSFIASKFQPYTLLGNFLLC
ncbi:unnamed protein product [Arabidopsis halleri]